MVSEIARPKMFILNPTAPPMPVDARLAPRPSDLNGKVLGLLNNRKLNASNLMDRVGEVLSERYEFASIVKLSKPSASRPCPQEIVEELVSRCDVIVTSNGD